MLDDCAPVAHWQARAALVLAPREREGERLCEVHERCGRAAAPHSAEVRHGALDRRKTPRSARQGPLSAAGAVSVLRNAGARVLQRLQQDGAGRSAPAGAAARRRGGAAARRRACAQSSST